MTGHPGVDVRPALRCGRSAVRPEPNPATGEEPREGCHSGGLTRVHCGGEEDLLRSAHRPAFQLASELAFRSVAAPAISTGVCGPPAAAGGRHRRDRGEASPVRGARPESGGVRAVPKNITTRGHSYLAADTSWSCPFRHGFPPSRRPCRRPRISL
ncbi:MAG: macro domain-containing protein, partial [Candidatus Dormibacteria bacterium]